MKYSLKQYVKRSICAIMMIMMVLVTFPAQVTLARDAETEAIVTETNGNSVERYEAAAKEANLTLNVIAHQQSFGNSAKAVNGKTAGTVGQGKRLEAVYISLKLPQGLKGGINYRSYVQSSGWTPWVTSGKMSGTKGAGKRLEGISIKLTGAVAKQYDIYYRTYMTNVGWLDWAKNGQLSGSAGLDAQLEGIQVLAVKKGSNYAPIQGRYFAFTAKSVNTVSYDGHVQTYGDMQAVSNGAVFGSTGSGKRLEGFRIRLSHGMDQVYGTLSYSVHCQSYGWMNEVKEGAYAGTRGEGKRIEALKITLNGDLSKYFDIYYRLHVQSLGWLDWAKNGEYAGTSGCALRAEAIQIVLRSKGAQAPGNTARHFVGSDPSTGKTAGYSLLKPYLDYIIASCTKPSMTKQQKLRAVYDYVRTHYLYRSLQPGHPSYFTQEEYYAYVTAENGSGNCYGINYLFGYLAREVGYPQARLAKGGLGMSRSPHGWVVIDGAIYDPEMAYEKQVDVYCAQNGSVYRYYED